MAIVGISITKETSFRDSVQPFSNMYFYNNGLGGAPDSSAAQNMLQELVDKEKTFHSTAVEFVFGRVWLQALTEIGSTMIYQSMLSGLGTQSQNTSMDKERAFLFRRRAGQDSRGQPVYLRKWYHACGEFGGTGTTINSTILANTAGFGDAARTALANRMQGISNIDAGGGGWVICSKGGRSPTEPNWVAHRYLEHHQLGDQWRGA
jgi:hypothetical protein